VRLTAQLVRLELTQEKPGLNSLRKTLQPVGKQSAFGRGWQTGSGTSTAIIPLKPKYGLNGAPSICCRCGKSCGALVGLRPGPGRFSRRLFSPSYSQSCSDTKHEFFRNFSRRDDRGFPERLVAIGVAVGVCAALGMGPVIPSMLVHVPYYTHKSERAISLARSRPLYSDFSEIWFGFQITTLVTPESFGTHKLTPAFTSLFYDHPRCENFPIAAGLQLPGPSLVADSRRRLLVRSLLWKITLPLKAILLASNGIHSASGKFLLWK
jgi:hypothetical protein